MTAWLDMQTIGNATVYLGDTMQIVPALGLKVNLVVSDLPYKLTSGGQSLKGMQGKFSAERYDNGGSIIAADLEFSDYMPMLAETLDEGDAYFMVNNRHVVNVGLAAEQAGFKFHNWLVWDKRTATANRWYMKNCEFTLYVYRGAAKAINDCSSKQLVFCPNVINAPHDTQKPVPLMELYIRNSSNQGDLVFDPFMGSGTTGVAALQLGRRFVGIELERKWFDLACHRLEREPFAQDTFF